MVFNSNIKQISPLRPKRSVKFYDLVWYLTQMWKKSVLYEQNELEHLTIFYDVLIKMWKKSVLYEQSRHENFTILYHI